MTLIFFAICCVFNFLVKQVTIFSICNDNTQHVFTKLAKKWNLTNCKIIYQKLVFFPMCNLVQQYIEWLSSTPTFFWYFVAKLFLWLHIFMKDALVFIHWWALTLKKDQGWYWPQMKLCNVKLWMAIFN